MPLYVELVAGWVTEERSTEIGRTPGHVLPAFAVLGASLLLAVLPPAIGLLILLGRIG
ncbi:MAG TPA: hypothetical protein VKF28_09320 [Candidatus Dormibacteraeota bacterium]|nr:hypothetical protein [Candidatus Dormibacteraeota bacterium]